MINSFNDSINLPVELQYRLIFLMDRESLNKFVKVSKKHRAMVMQLRFAKEFAKLSSPAHFAGCIKSFVKMEEWNLIDIFMHKNFVASLRGCSQTNDEKLLETLINRYSYIRDQKNGVINTLHDLIREESYDRAFGDHFFKMLSCERFDVDAQDQDGNTAIHLLACDPINHGTYLQALVQRGADYNEIENIFSVNAHQLVEDADTLDNIQDAPKSRRWCMAQGYLKNRKREEEIANNKQLLDVNIFHGRVSDRQIDGIFRNLADNSYLFAVKKEGIFRPSKRLYLIYKKATRHQNSKIVKKKIALEQGAVVYKKKSYPTLQKAAEQNLHCQRPIYFWENITPYWRK